MKVFVTGATGYIGGSVAKALINAGHEVFGLVRDPNKVAALRSLDVEPVLGDLEDADLLVKYAQLSDAVINTANSDHSGAVETFIKALQGSGKAFLHTSGSSIVGDDVLGDYESKQVYSDDTPFTPMEIRKERIALNNIVRKAGIESGIRAMVITPSMIYGEALGLPAVSDQLPKIMSISTRMEAGAHVGKGVNRWSNVHIKDLTKLYLLALEKGPAGAMFYAENGEESLYAIAQSISIALGFEGKTVSWLADDAIKEYGDWARFAIASNSRIRAVNARNLLGWKPKEEAILDWIVKSKKDRFTGVY